MPLRYSKQIEGLHREQAELEQEMKAVQEKDTAYPGFTNSKYIASPDDRRLAVRHFKNKVELLKVLQASQQLLSDPCVVLTKCTGPKGMAGSPPCPWEPHKTREASNNSGNTDSIQHEALEFGSGGHDYLMLYCWSDRFASLHVNGELTARLIGIFAESIYLFRNSAPLSHSAFQAVRHRSWRLLASAEVSMHAASLRRCKLSPCRLPNGR